MVNNETNKLAALAVFLRVYGVLSLIIFGSLFVGFAIETPLLAEGGALNWLIWNGIQCGREPCHVHCDDTAHGEDRGQRGLVGAAGLDSRPQTLTM